MRRHAQAARKTVFERVFVVVKYTLNKCTSERLHSERDNVMSSDVTFKVFVKLSSKEYASGSGTL